MSDAGATAPSARWEGLGWRGLGRHVALALTWAATAALCFADPGRTAGIRSLLLVLAAATLVLGVRWRWPLATSLSVGLLVASYAVGLVFRETVDERAPLVAAGVVAVVLLASWASEPPSRPVPRATGTVVATDPWAARAVAVAGAVLLALALAGVVLAASAAGVSRSLWLQVAGAAAVVAAVAALGALSRRAAAP